MAPLLWIRITFVRPSPPGIFRTQSIYHQRVGLLTKIFTGATPRFLFCTKHRKLLDWEEWVPGQPRTVRLAGISSPGPWRQRVLRGRVRRNVLWRTRKVTCLPYRRCSTTWRTVFQLALYEDIATPIVHGDAISSRVRAVRFPNACGRQKTPRPPLGRSSRATSSENWGIPCKSGTPRP